MNFETGQPVPRTEDPRLLKGAGKYTDDLNYPHQTQMIVVRSPHAHAVIKNIDITLALAVPGVVAVLTGEDYNADGMGDIIGGSPRKRRDGTPMYRPPRPALTRDRVRHIGQAVVLVIGETADAAKDGAEAVVIDYAPLPLSLSGADNEPVLWDEIGDHESFVYKVGDEEATEQAISRAPHVIKQKFVVNRITANSMEPRGAIGLYDPGNDRYTIHTGHQRPWAFRTSLTKNTFKIGEHQLSLITGDMGGSFGMKGSIYPEIPLVGWAAKRIGRPVKWVADRGEGISSDDHARDNVTEAELALDQDGNFLAMRVSTEANLGAYVSFMGMGPSTGNVGGLAGAYTTPSMFVEVVGRFSNLNPISPYRGAGRPEASYVMERMIHLAARELEIDPIELRRRNMISPTQMPYKTPLTFTYDCGEFEAMMDLALAKADHAGFNNRRKKAAENGLLRGIGVSCTVEQAAGAQPETAEMRFDPSGTLTLLVGSTPHGQGHETIYKQLIAEKLAIDPANIRVIEGDTDKVSFGTGTGGSRTASIGTSAVFEAIGKVVDKTLKVAANLLEASDTDIEFARGSFTVSGTDKSISFTEVAQSTFQPAKIPDGMEPGLYEIATFNPKKANFPNGCHISEVEIDPDTGAVKIVKYTVVDDVGFEINPLLVKGQVHGGIAQGAGQILMEDLHINSVGQTLAGTFLDYAMPRADDFCYFNVEGRPVPTETNPLGAKGAGECGTVGSMPSVMNAIIDAMAPYGVSHIDMPATPEKIWRAIQEASN